MRRAPMEIMCALMVFQFVAGCSDDEEPTSPSVRLSTEVTAAPDTVPQGAWASGLAAFSVVSGGDVEISFDQGVIIGYRIAGADGELKMEFPSEEYGPPTDFIVRPGWDERVIVNTPTTRFQAEEPNRFVTWHCEADTLPVGEYILEAGLYGLEARYPWGETTYTVVSPVAK